MCLYDAVAILRCFLLPGRARPARAPVRAAFSAHATLMYCQRVSEHPRNVYRLALRAVSNLVATAGAVRNQQRIGFARARGRQQIEFSHPHGHVVMFRVIAERACHPAAAGFDEFNFKLWNHLQDLLNGPHDAECFLMAVAMQQSAPSAQ